MTWTVAEGRRGRRWRETVVAASGLRHSLLLETFPDGRFSHLELATPAGLLTLHPEGDGTLHGNVVDDRGVRHVIGVAWEPDGCLEIEGSAIAMAVTAAPLRNAVARGASTSQTVLRIARGLAVSTGPRRVDRLDEETWQIDGSPAFRVDADGLPVLQGARTWPLEVEPAG